MIQLLNQYSYKQADQNIFETVQLNLLRPKMSGFSPDSQRYENIPIAKVIVNKQV